MESKSARTSLRKKKTKKKVCSNVKEVSKFIEDKSSVESTSEMEKNCRSRKESMIKNSNQVDLTRDEEEEGEVEEEDGKKKQEAGKDRKIKGRSREVRNEQEYMGMTVQEMRDHAVMLLDDAETVRLKSKSIQGTLSGILKDRIIGLRNVIDCLTDKLETHGDVIYFKTKNNELFAENKRLRKESEKWDYEKKLKDKEIDSYRSMYEEADNKYVEAEKRIRDIEKLGNRLGNEMDGYGNRRQELVEYSRNRQENTEHLEVEDKERTEENKRKSRMLDDLRWPAIRPPIKGKTRILTSVENSKVHRMIPLKNLDPVNVQESGASVSTPTSMVSWEMDEPEKEEKTNQNSKEEEIKKISSQIRMLAEERKKLRGEGGGRLGKPRIISNVQVAPPRKVTKDTTDQEGQQEEERIEPRYKRGNVDRRTSERSYTERRGSWKSGNRLRRPPKTAVVAIRAKNENVSYADVLKRARQEVSLDDIGIEVTKIKRGINGSLLIEIPGQEGNEKAKILADKLRDKLGDSDVNITRPVATAELKIVGLDASATKDEVRDTIAYYGNCNVEEVSTVEIRWMYNGLGMAWVKCPLGAANKVAKEGKIKIGWTVARVEILARRPLQCYRCWEFGHVRFSCKAKIDRQGSCYKCGIAGHAARMCTSEVPRCIVCEEKGFSSEHRIGSRFCKLTKIPERSRQLPRRMNEENVVHRKSESEVQKEIGVDRREIDRMDYKDEL